MKKLFLKKGYGDKAIMVEVGLAVVAVALLIIFRTAIAVITTDIISKAQIKIIELFDASLLTEKPKINI